MTRQNTARIPHSARLVSGRFAVLSDPVPVAGRVTATSGPSMQLFGEGKVQGKGVVAIPPLGRPDTPMFDG